MGLLSASRGLKAKIPSAREGGANGTQFESLGLQVS